MSDLLKRLTVEDHAINIAEAFLSEPDARAQCKVKLAVAGMPSVADMIDEGVVMARELLRIKAALANREGMVMVPRADLELAVDYFQELNAGHWECVKRWRAILLDAARKEEKYSTYE